MRRCFASGVDSIVEAQEQVARNYFADGSVDAACPPVRALLEIMVHGQYEGMTINDPRLRAMFTREATIASEWYQERLLTKQQRDCALWRRHLEAVEKFRPTAGFDIASRMTAAREQLARVSSPAYLEQLIGTIGADPFHCQI